MGLPIEIVNQGTDWPAIVQAVGSIAAILISVLLALGVQWLSENAARRRDKQAADDRGVIVKTMLGMAIATIRDIEAKENAARFTLDNAGSSFDDIQASLDMLGTLPLSELRPSELTAVAGVRKHVLTTRRRIGFIQNHLRAGTQPKRRITFKGLAKQAEAFHAALP